MIRRSGARRAASKRAVRPRRSPFRSRLQRVQSWGALLVALGLLIAQGPMLLHLLLVQHATCEHGELVEVSTTGASTRHVVSASSAPSSPSEQAGAHAAGPLRERLDAADGKGAGHDHCDVLGVRHRPTELVQTVVAPSLLSLELSPSLSARLEARPVALLALAPKSSPPAA